MAFIAVFGYELVMGGIVPTLSFRGEIRLLFFHVVQQNFALIPPSSGRDRYCEFIALASICTVKMFQLFLGHRWRVKFKGFNKQKQHKSPPWLGFNLMHYLL